MSISSNLIEIKKTIPEHVKLVAVSKFHPVDAVREAYAVGQKYFGESRQQEFTLKYKELPSDIEWHFIGHLQTNKIKAILPGVHTIHSIDSWKLLNAIEAEAVKLEREIHCLLEIHIAEEESKYGLSFDNCRSLLESEDWKNLKYVRISGLMGMATYTEDMSAVRKEFQALKQFFDELKNTTFRDYKYFTEISMGMSHDYKIAIEEGSTMVRIGTSIFGERQ